MADTPTNSSPKSKRKLRMASTQLIASISPKLCSKKVNTSPPGKRKNAVKVVNQSTDFSKAAESCNSPSVLKGGKASQLRQAKTISQMSGSKAMRILEEQQ